MKLISAGGRTQIGGCRRNALAPVNFVCLDGSVQFVIYGAAVLVAYLLGSIPTGFLVAKAKGIDIRTVGSGNIGATNVFRALGTPAGVFVLLFDGLKGYAACAWLTDLLMSYGGGAAVDRETLKLIGGVSAILGHNYTCWLGFKGGKGIATSAGVLIALVPWALLIILSIWIVVFTATRYVSLASLAASFSLPFAAWLTHGSLTLIVVSSMMSALAIYKHRANIQRLLNGTESRVAFRRKESAP